MHSALLRVMSRKFRNVRSPSPTQSGPNAPDAASPQTFSPWQLYNTVHAFVCELCEFTFVDNYLTVTTFG